MQVKTITLGGKAFEIRELPLRANSEWRRTFEQKLEPLLGMFAGLDKLEITNAADLARVISMLREVVLRSPEMLAELMFDYSPALASDRMWIEENVYESELLAGVTEVLALAYPFGAILQLARSLNGAAVNPGATTSKSSPLPNGQGPIGRTKRRR